MKFWNVVGGAVLGTAGLVAPAHAVFTMEELQRGLSEQDALSTVRGRNNVAERLKGEEGFLVLREAKGDVRGMFWTCNGKVHAASALQEGGIYAFLDRVSELTKSYGRGEVEAQGRTVAGGTVRTIETYWKAFDNVIKLTYSPDGARRAEAMWLQSSVPSVCAK